MPKWPRGMVGPTLLLWGYAAAYAIVSIVVGRPRTLSAGMELISNWALSLVISIWIFHDARKRGRQLFYDYGMFVFFWWPVVAPVYLFQTRGVRAFVTLLCFVGIWLFFGISVGVASLLREGLSP